MTRATTKLLSLALFACLIASVMSAGTIAPCTTALLSVYLAATAPCEVGSLEFSGFAYSNTFLKTLPGPSAANILVTPSSNPADPGLEFSSTWTASGAGNGMDSSIIYVVSTVSGAPALDGAAFGMTDIVNSLPLSIEYGETLCLGEIVTATGQCSKADEFFLSIQGATAGYRQTSGSFAPVSELTVLDDIFIKSQGADGNGSISEGNNNFSTEAQAPEPGAAWLGLSGLLVLWRMATVHRRRPR